MSEPPKNDEAPPDDPEAAAQRAAFAAAVRAFTAGDFATARRQLTALRARALDPAARASVDELWRRTGADPAAVWAAIGSGVLFLVVVYLTYWR
jgi:hypothetical protein